MLVPPLGENPAQTGVLQRQTPRRSLKRGGGLRLISPFSPGGAVQAGQQGTQKLAWKVTSWFLWSTACHTPHSTGHKQEPLVLYAVSYLLSVYTHAFPGTHHLSVHKLRHFDPITFWFIKSEVKCFPHVSKKHYYMSFCPSQQCRVQSHGSVLSDRPALGQVCAYCIGVNLGLQKL